MQWARHIGGDSKPSPGWFSLEMLSSKSHSIREAENKKEFVIAERNYIHNSKHLQDSKWQMLVPEDMAAMGEVVYL